MFLCHASEDKGSVRPYRDLLLSEGFATWLDEDDIIPGQSWDAAIQDAIRRAHAVIVFVSRHSSKEGYLQREITAVLDQAEHRPRDEIFVIPALLEDSPLPDRLRSYQWVALHEASGFHKLKAALDTLRPLPST